MKLNVGYKSQWDSDASASNSDCGPTCVAMVLNYYGENLYTDEVFKRTGAGGGLITISQLQKAIKYFGYRSNYIKNNNIETIFNLLGSKAPVIALIKYAPLSSRQDKGYKGGHFVVITGIDDDCFIVNDPDFYGNYREHGHHHRYLKKEFLEAWGTCHKDGNPNNSLLVINRKDNMSNELAECLKAHQLLMAKIKKLEKELKEKSKVVISQAKELTELRKYKKELVDDCDELLEKYKKAEVLRKKWFTLSKQNQANFNSCKVDKAMFEKKLTEMTKLKQPKRKLLKKVFYLMLEVDQLLDKLAKVA